MRNRMAGGWIAPAGLAALSIVLLSFGLDRHSLWMDDGYSLWFSSRFEIPVLDDGETDGNMVLYYLLLWAWRLGGSEDAWLRLLSVLWAAAGTALAVRLFAMLTTRRLAWTAGLWLVTNPLLVDLALEVRGYTQLYCLCTLLVYALLRQLEDGDRRWCLLIIVAAVAAVATHYFAIVFILLLSAWATFEYALQRCPRRRDVLLALGCAALLAAIYIALSSGDRHGRLMFLSNWGLLIVPHYLYKLSGHTLFSPLLLFAAVPIVLTALLARRVVRGGSVATLSLHRLVLLWIALPFIAFALISELVQPIYRERYLIWLLPAFAALVPALAGQTDRERPWLMLLLAMCASNLMAVSAFYGRVSNEDWRAAAHVLVERESDNSGTIPLLFHAYGGRYVFDAYASRESALAGRLCYLKFRTEAAVADGDQLSRLPSWNSLETIAREREMLWLISSHIQPARTADLQRAIELLVGERTDHDAWQRRPRMLESIVDTLEGAYDTSESWSLPGVTLRRFERNAGVTSDREGADAGAGARHLCEARSRGVDWARNRFGSHAVLADGCAGLRCAMTQQ